MSIVNLCIFSSNSLFHIYIYIYCGFKDSLNSLIIFCCIYIYFLEIKNIEILEKYISREILVFIIIVHYPLE